MPTFSSGCSHLRPSASRGCCSMLVTGCWLTRHLPSTPIPNVSQSLTTPASVPTHRRLFFVVVGMRGRRGSWVEGWVGSGSGRKVFRDCLGTNQSPSRQRRRTRRAKIWANMKARAPVRRFVNTTFSCGSQSEKRGRLFGVAHRCTQVGFSFSTPYTATAAVTPLPLRLRGSPGAPRWPSRERGRRDDVIGVCDGPVSSETGVHKRSLPSSAPPPAQRGHRLSGWLGWYGVRRQCGDVCG